MLKKSLFSLIVIAFIAISCETPSSPDESTDSIALFAAAGERIPAAFIPFNVTITTTTYGESIVSSVKLTNARGETVIRNDINSSDFAVYVPTSFIDGNVGIDGDPQTLITVEWYGKILDGNSNWVGSIYLRGETAVPVIFNISNAIDDNKVKIEYSRGYNIGGGRKYGLSISQNVLVRNTNGTFNERYHYW